MSCKAPETIRGIGSVDRYCIEELSFNDMQNFLCTPHLSNPWEYMVDARMMFLGTSWRHSILWKYLIVSEFIGISGGALDSNTRRDPTENDGIDISTSQLEIEFCPIECSPLSLCDGDIR